MENKIHQSMDRLRPSGVPSVPHIPNEPLFTAAQIGQILPHRYPFQLVDKIMMMDDTNIVGIKNVTISEPYFQGHFPDNPVMPGVLQLETMAQVAGVWVMKHIEQPADHILYIAGMEQTRFKRQVVPGDVLLVHCVLTMPPKRGISKMLARGYVNNKLVVETEMIAGIVKNTLNTKTK